MFKRGRRDAYENADAGDLSEVAMMIMGIGGKEMTNLELLKREERDLMTRQMMRRHQQNFLRESGPRGSDGPLTPEMANSSFESSQSSYGDGDPGNNVMP